MILGIGTDIVSIERLRGAMERHESFGERAFTELERTQALQGGDRMQRLAGRWAAKEALAKALGTGCGSCCSWQEILIENEENGKPRMILSGRTLETFQKMGGVKLHLSISHEEAYACATVIIEGE